MYRILVAFLTAFESFADCALSWLPMYGEAKLAVVVYLWHPKTMASRHPRPHPAEQDSLSLSLLVSLHVVVGLKQFSILWSPSPHQGARHVYDDYLRPFLAAHEADIDRGLVELRARAADATASHLQAAVALGRACLSEVARRVSSQLQQAATSAGPAAQVR